MFDSQVGATRAGQVPFLSRNPFHRTVGPSAIDAFQLAGIKNEVGIFRAGPAVKEFIPTRIARDKLIEDVHPENTTPRVLQVSRLAGIDNSGKAAGNHGGSLNAAQILVAGVNAAAQCQTIGII